MNEIGTVERVIRVDLKSLVLQILLLALVMLAARWAMPVGYRDVYPASMAFIGVVLVFSLWPVIRAAATGGGAIVITDRGLLNRTGGVGFVEWKEIASARIVSQLGMKRVELEVHNLYTVLDRISPVRRWLLERSITKYGGKPSVYVTSVQASANEILDIINAKRHGA